MTQNVTLRVRAGEVSVEVEWAQEGVAHITAHPPATAPMPVTEAPSPVPSAPIEESERYLTAPTVGVFYRASEPNAPPFVREGDTVVVGQQVGIVEVMKLMIPIEAHAAGRVVKVLKANGESVEYGERLFALAPADSS